MPPKSTNIVQFPCDHLVSPGVFQVEILTGTIVYFLLKGVIIEGKMVSYFAHITPNETLAQLGGLEGGAKPADVSKVGYAVEYFVPNPQRQYDPTAEPLVRQVQLLDRDEIFLSKAAVSEHLWKNCFLPLPENKKV